MSIQRKVTIRINQVTKQFDSQAETLRDLKAELDKKGIVYSGYDFFEGISKSQIMSDDSILPKSLPYKGTITNDLVFNLTIPNKKITSGYNNPLLSDVYGVINRVEKKNLEQKIPTNIKDAIIHLINILNANELISEIEAEQVVNIIEGEADIDSFSEESEDMFDFIK